MRIFQSRSFEKKVRKFSKKEKENLDKHIQSIAKCHDIGDEKKGDLKGVFIYKFKIKTTQYLLAYRMVDNDLELIMIGPHENYYKALKKYIKTRR